MAKIIASPKMGCEQEWIPFNENGDIENVIKDAWDKYIKNSPLYDEVYRLAGRDIPCECHYPPTPRSETLENPKFFEFYHGCAFDLDAYNANDKYVKAEVESLPDSILAGAISKLEKKFSSKPKGAKLFPLPIKNEIGVALYLREILVLFKAELERNKANENLRWV